MDRLFEESPEEEAAELGAAPVEAEGKLVEVRLEVVPRHSSLVRAQQPSLHEARNTVYSRQNHMGLDAGAGDGEGPVPVVIADGGRVRRKAIRDDHRARLYAVEQEPTVASALRRRG